MSRKAYTKWGYLRSSAHRRTKQEWLEDLYVAARKGAVFAVVTEVPTEDVRLFADWFAQSDFTSPSDALLYLWRMSAENPDIQALRLSHETTALLKLAQSHIAASVRTLFAELQVQITEALNERAAQWGDHERKG